jgi:Arc/MetJ family transcription regulator
MSGRRRLFDEIRSGVAWMRVAIIPILTSCSGTKWRKFDEYPCGHCTRTTLNLDDALIAEAQRLAGIKERTAVIHEGLRALIALVAAETPRARSLASFSGSWCMAAFATE